MEWNFVSILMSALVFFFWFAAIWIFIGVLADIFRRDMSGWAKAGWIILIVLLPLLGVLIYIVSRPKMADIDDGMIMLGTSSRRGPAGYRPADEIAKAAQLYDQGKISADDYEHLKRQALAR
jgi:hypothetical protein